MSRPGKENGITITTPFETIATTVPATATREEAMAAFAKSWRREEKSPAPALYRWLASTAKSY